MTAAEPAREFGYAGFWIRVLARIIDIVILVVVGALIRLPFAGILRLAPGVSIGEILGVAGSVTFLRLCIAVGYETFFLGRYGATPGKMACRLKVIRADGSPLTYGRAFGRYWGYVLSGFTLAVGYIMAAWILFLRASAFSTLAVGYIMAAFTEQKRALHDFICDTRVVWG